MTDYNENSIKILEGLEAVRMRPAMYIGSTGQRGINHLVYEIVDNAVDEHLAGHCTEIYVKLCDDGSCEVSDNGRGIPVGLHSKGLPAERIIFTTLHAGGKFDNKSYNVSGGLHGVGSSVVNALSDWLVVNIKRDNKIWFDRYERGVPVASLEDNLLPVIGACEDTGTKISFHPDPEIFGKLKFKGSDIKERLHETAYLNPGLYIYYEDERNNEEILYHEPDGIKQYIVDCNVDQTVLHEPIIISGQADGDEGLIQADIAFQYVQDFQERMYGFCNNVSNPEGGSHLTGFRAALTTVVNQFARSLNILKEKDDNFLGTDVRTGLTAIVSVKHTNPRFEGQTKTKLDNQDATRVVSQISSEYLKEYFDKHTDVVRDIISMAEKSVKARKSAAKSKELLLAPKKKFSFDSNGKLANCESRDASKCEIFIVEGDSAGGSAKTARNREYQAILPIRGKILNVEKATMQKVLANAEIKTMIYAFGCGFLTGYGNDFDISKLNYNKIILMTDADVDGRHIDTLLMTFFYRFMPEIITNGNLYLANPPLYKVIPKKGESFYIRDDKGLAEYRKHHKDSSFILNRMKGLGELAAEELWETTMNPETRMLTQVSLEDAITASKLTSTLMGDAVDVRKTYIHENSNLATLDV